MPERPPKRWFNRCLKANADKDDPQKFCGWLWHHGTLPTTKKRILRKHDPKPHDLSLRCDALIRTVPEVDNLLEVALYTSRRDFHAIRSHVEGLKDLEDKPGTIVRRGRTNKATNIFIYGA